MNCGWDIVYRPGFIRKRKGSFQDLKTNFHTRHNIAIGFINIAMQWKYLFVVNILI